MISHSSHRPASALRVRMIEDMSVRGFSEKTRNDYIRNVRAFAAFIGRSPDTATAEDLRRFQLHQTQSGMQPPSINSAVSALRFFFTVTLDRPDLARRLTIVRQPRRLPPVLSVEEVTLLLQAAPGPKYTAAQLRHAPAGAGYRHPRHPSAARPRQARHHGALYPRRQHHDPNRDQPARPARAALRRGTKTGGLARRR